MGKAGALTSPFLPLPGSASPSWGQLLCKRGQACESPTGRALSQAPCRPRLMLSRQGQGSQSSSRAAPRYPGLWAPAAAALPPAPSTPDPALASLLATCGPSQGANPYRFPKLAMHWLPASILEITSDFRTKQTTGAFVFEKPHRSVKLTHLSRAPLPPPLLLTFKADYRLPSVSASNAPGPRTTRSLELLTSCWPLGFTATVGDDPAQRFFN